MRDFIISENNFLNLAVPAYFQRDYTGYQTENNPDFINKVKNQFLDVGHFELANAQKELERVLEADLQMIRNFHQSIHLDICLVPRSKAENSYAPNQKLFKQTVLETAARVGGFTNGGHYIVRHTNTRTTHLNKSGCGGDGDMPHPGITKATCTISTDVRGRNILLVDDIYTQGVNVDEDAIQALLDAGAARVIFYAVAKTYKGDYGFESLGARLRDTYYLMELGYGFDDIAQKRGLSSKKIFDHAIELSKKFGRNLIRRFEPSLETINEVRSAVRKLGSGDKLKPIYLELGERVSYEDIKLSLLFMDDYD